MLKIFIHILRLIFRLDQHQLKKLTPRCLLPTAYCLLLVTAYCLLPTACGKRRPPLPPFENVPQTPPLISGVQQGNQVVLSWLAPLRNAPDTSVQSIRRIDVYRIVEDLEDPLPLTEEQFGQRASVIGSIDYETLQLARESNQNNLTYVDTLAFGASPVRLRYAIRYVNASNQRAAFSNFLLLEPASRISLPPQLTELSESQNAISVRWTPPSSNVDGSVPINFLGFNLYRLSPTSGERVTRPLNSAPITTTEFRDTTFRFDVPYTYIVRTISLGTLGRQVESLNSNALSVTPRDVYPPSAPVSVSIAAAPNRLTLFYPANPEIDVTGYLIFRATDDKLPPEQWTPLTDEPLNRTSYQDERVESGTRYFYFVVAVDAAGNRSPPSETVSDIAP
ncbi:MAG: hypothetical protein MSG64_04540 [Pyrinomonadaceae bacterium MAG19_C2-C3]|nr:hypothetical protein [Pyrinomonadaceae bacterium MAG19_C2-C3]